MDERGGVKYGVRRTEKDNTVKRNLWVSLFYRILNCLNVFPISDISYLQKHTISFNGNRLIPGSSRQDRSNDRFDSS